MKDAWLVIGLGNPGRSYASHRHNAGYLAVEDLARAAAGSFAVSLRLGAEVCQTRIDASGRIGAFGADATKVVLMKSRSYMNETGRAVQRVAGYFGVEPKRMIAVHDELDLDPGRIRVKFGGGDNGHNGLKSIRRHLGTGDFYRVRVGIGRPSGSQAPADYVLSAVASTGKESFLSDAARAGDAVTTLIAFGLETAQNQFNS